MVVTGRIQDLILNPQETGRVTEVIAEGEYYGMQTFDQALLKHVAAGNITEEVAFEVASSPHDFKLMLAAQGSASERHRAARRGRRRATATTRRLTSVRKALSYTRLWRSGRAAIESPPDRRRDG